MDKYEELLKLNEEQSDKARSATVDYVHAVITNQKIAVGKLKSYDSSKTMDYDGFICGYINIIFYI